MAHDPVSKVASWVTTSADDNSGDDIDAELRSLFLEWIAAERHPDAISDKNETAHQAALARIKDAIDQIADLPATGIVGLAIKVYVCILRAHDGGTPEDPAAMRDYLADRFERSTLEDVRRILPEAPQLVG